MSRLWVALVGVLAMLTMAGVASTTTASAASFAYDVPTVARVGVHEIGSADSGLAQRSDVRDGSASHSVEGRRRSTTPLVRNIATNKVAATGEDLLKPGPWAEGSVPSSAPGKITQAERNALNPIGDEFGCHSCGTTTPGTKSGNWVGDHQPVSSQVPPGTPQVLYPQCLACSNDQGLYIINQMRQGPR